MSVLDLRIDWSDLDVFGHVNNVAILRHVQSARVHFWEETGVLALRPRGVVPMLATTSCRFASPLTYPETIRMETRVAFLKTSSFGLEHRILASGGVVAATAEDVVVMFDEGASAKVAIPVDLRSTLVRYVPEGSPG